MRATFTAVVTEDSQSLVSAVEARLLDAIIGGDIRLGERIVEARIARQMGISRAPLREAARRLEQRGLLLTTPNRGFSVRTYSAKQIDDLYSFRLEIERFAVEIACARADQAGLGRLATQLTVLSEAAHRGNRRRVLRESVEFHQTLCDIGGNSYLSQAFRQISADVEIATAHLSQVRIDASAIIERNSAVLVPILARDAAGAWALIRSQIEAYWSEVRDRAHRMLPDVD